MVQARYIDHLFPSATPGPRYVIEDKVDDPTTVIALRLPISGLVPSIIVAFSLPMAHVAISKTVVLEDIEIGVI